eukprot:249054-Chlamydomonas_euryale.AAC.3
MTARCEQYGADSALRCCCAARWSAEEGMPLESFRVAPCGGVCVSCTCPWRYIQSALPRNLRDPHIQRFGSCGAHVMMA